MGCESPEYSPKPNEYSELLIRTKQGPSKQKFRGGRGVELASICRLDENDVVIDCIENVSDLKLSRSGIDVTPIIRSDKTGICTSSTPNVRLGNTGYIQFNLKSKIKTGDRIRVSVLESPECPRGYEYELFGINEVNARQTLICEGSMTKVCTAQ